MSKNADNDEYMARGKKLKRFLTLPLLYLAWFSPHKRMSVFFIVCAVLK